MALYLLYGIVSITRRFKLNELLVGIDLAPGISILGIPTGDTQNTSVLGTGVPKTRGYPKHCDTGFHFHFQYFTACTVYRIDLHNYKLVCIYFHDKLESSKYKPLSKGQSGSILG